jgi:hypothetical protein
VQGPIVGEEHPHRVLVSGLLVAGTIVFHASTGPWPMPRHDRGKWLINRAGTSIGTSGWMYICLAHVIRWGDVDFVLERYRGSGGGSSIKRIVKILTSTLWSVMCGTTVCASASARET